ncbi:response regulator, partial [bacterium]|nr:response regulator [bacterium]
TDVILKMSIKDTGIGIPKDSQQYIFESFRQADGSTTRRYGGTGLGLAISKSIVEAMGGELQLNSIENVGTEFYFQINFQKALLPIKSQSFSDFSSLRKASILYIDDNQLSLDIVASHCKKVGLQLTTTQNASEALHLIKEKDFDIILLDTRIPEYNGFNLLKDIRSLVNCPITALTTDIRPSTISKIKSSAFNGYLIKPVRAESLLKVLAKLIAELPDEKVTLNETLVTADSLICLDILIAEDNLVNQKLIHRLLTNMGHNPTLADDGSIAYEAATKDRFDLIFMDMKMPNMSGTEATKLIVKAGIKTPIIAMTANASKEDQQECLDAGMVNFITKPLKRDVLRDILFKYSHLNQKIKIPKQARLLIADDNPLVLSALSHFCHRAFPLVTIKLAKDGIEACAYLGSFLPHVIITDIMMPNMNGLDLIRFIKKDQRYQHTKVIALSAMSKNDPIIKDILDLDVFAYLNKPYEGEILKSKMQAALDSSFQDT